MFRLHATKLLNESKIHMLENRARGGELWPVTVEDSMGAKGMRGKARKALENLVRVVDEDVFFLLSEEEEDEEEESGTEPGDADDGRKYILKAYASPFPSGFNPTQKLGLPLSAIHSPVPGYADKLERGMDRFFGRLQPGTYKQRTNWTVTTGTGLFAAFGGVHGGDDDMGEELRADELDLESVCFFFSFFFLFVLRVIWLIR